MFEKIKMIFTSQKAIDIYKRAGKTFIQAALSTMIVNLGSVNPDLSMIRPIIIGGIAAGVSAVMNLILSLLKDDYY